MMNVALITLFLSALGAMPALAAKDGEMVVDGHRLQVMVILLEGKRDFTVFVRPNTVGRDIALKATTKKVWPLCRDMYAAQKMRIVKMKRRSWAVPLDWRIDGICE